MREAGQVIDDIARLGREAFNRANAHPWRRHTPAILAKPTNKMAADKAAAAGHARAGRLGHEP